MEILECCLVSPWGCFQDPSLELSKLRMWPTDILQVKWGL